MRRQLGAFANSPPIASAVDAALVESFKQAVIDQVFSPLSCSTPLKALVDQERGIPYGIIQTGKHEPNGVPTVRAGDIKRFSLLKDGLKRVSREIAINTVVRYCVAVKYLSQSAVQLVKHALFRLL
jgi:type I restriction enzyme S subunit